MATPTSTSSPDLDQLDTEHLSFHAIAGETQLRLLPTPYPAENLPPPSASLLAIASTKGLVAAAGPEGLVIARTSTIRDAFKQTSGGGKTVDFTPELTLAVGRCSQVAFSSDEACLVVVAEQGGGLGVYDTNALLKGNKDTAFTVGTNGVGVRQLLPNPNPSSELAHMFGLVLETGQLLLADLSKQDLSKNAQGNPVFAEGVTSACWSRLGKQIVAGRGDGTAAQIDPQGNIKAEIPLPPRLPELSQNSPMALMSIYWLDTNEFLLIHTPTTPPSLGDSDGMMDESMPVDSVFHLASRPNPKSTDWKFANIIDPAPSLGGSGRSPAHHFIQRLRDWPPGLDELLLSISTSSTDVGMLTKASVPLNTQTPITGTFATTNGPDTHRAGLPLSLGDGMTDTSAVGMAVDLSSTELILSPIPSDSEVRQSSVPFPGLWVLNNEGILRIWWVVFSPSVREGKAYPDLVAVGGPRGLSQGTPAGIGQAASGAGSSVAGGGGFGGMAPPAKSVTSPMGGSAFGAPSMGAKASPWGTAAPGGSASPAPAAATLAFGASSMGAKASPWGAPASTGGSASPAPATSTFGAPSKPAFGASSMGAKASPWGTAPATSASPVASPTAPAFGSTTPIGGGGGGGFGQVGGMGGKGSPWGGGAGSTAAGTGTGTGAGGTFGKPSGSGGNSGVQASPFASAFGGKKENAVSPFATAGSGSGLGGGLGSGGGDLSKQNPFAASANTGNKVSPFAAAAGGSGGGSFGSTATLGSFGSGGSVGGGGSSGTFGMPSLPSGSTGGASGSGWSFGRPSAPVSREGTTMGEEKKPAEENKPAEVGSEIKGLFSGGGGFKLGSTFRADGSAKEDGPPVNPATGKSFFGGGFGQALGKAAATEGEKKGPVTPVKKEPGEDEGPKLSDIPAVSTTPAGAPNTKTEDDPLKYKAKRFAGDLPPMDVPAGKDEEDPLEYKAKRFAGDVPPVEEEEVRPSVEKAEEDKPLAGSPAIDLGGFGGSEEGEVPAGPEDDDDEEWSEEDEGEDEDEDEDAEGEDEDDDEDDGDEREVQDQKGLSAFEARLHPASPTRPEQKEEESTTPATERKPTGALPSFTPAGLPKHNVNFKPPVQESPRSPSPMRSSTGPAAMLQQQQKPSFGEPSTSSVFSQGSSYAQVSKQQISLFKQSKPQTKASPKPVTSKTSSVFDKPSPKGVTSKTASVFDKPSKPQTQSSPKRIAVPPAQLAKKASPAPAKVEEPTAGELEDAEDARVKDLLATDPEPRLELPEFLAHQDYVGESSKEGLGGQIEMVYRDVNSMIDTVGLNGHALQGFVRGQEELKQFAAGKRGVETLEDEEGWTLDEGGELERLMLNDLWGKLDAGRLEQVPALLEDLAREAEELGRLKGKAGEMRRRIKGLTDPEQVEKIRGAPLSQEALGQQSELRMGVQKVQKCLGQVEEAMTLLRAELASTAAKSNATSNGAGVPTLEAVTNTILKLTAMMEKKSGDIDVLESQIRKLPNGAASLPKLDNDYEDQLVASLAGSKLLKASPHNTPTASRSRMLANGDAPGMNAMLGRSRFSTPPSASRNGGRRSVMFSPEASRLGMSTSSMSGTPRRKMVDVTEAEVEAYRSKADQRRAVLSALRKEVERKGARVVKVDG
ncbi:hypothetical protein LTR56_017254 [Elasticomyces elasticus]|nr:hypothetical protein LTR56_017254 [Elasticomyces elasticus]KAK3644849.1 hypothetical protein LTR22_014995 [Elasticomyces elasticus]KAK4923318.1 hypothetical protein LTR49_009388 [Elasticomyces elasticus]KAK5751128.1 hypothetical protein LTS12_018762 [Elasticomyces elasticus]